MSHEATAWSFDQPENFPDMKPTESKVLDVLADCHNPIHGCFPSQEYLSRRTNIDPRTVRRQLVKLKKRGLVKWDETKEKGKRKPNRYKLAFEEDFDSDCFEKPEGKLSAGKAKTRGQKQQKPEDKNDKNQRAICPPNLVKEPVKESLSGENASEDGAGAQEREGKNPDDGERVISPSEKKRLLIAWHSFEEKFNSSEKKLIAIASKLDPETLLRATCIERIRIFKSLTSQTKHRIHYSTYVEDRKFDTEPVIRELARLDLIAEQEEAEKQKKEREREEQKSVVQLRPFGKAWMAVWILRQENDLPVNDEELDGAVLKRSEVPDFEHFVQVNRDSAEWHAWAEWFVDKGYEFPKRVAEWIWVPQVQAPEITSQMVWEIQPYSAEYVSEWSKHCRQLGGGIVRRWYDNCLERNTSMKLSWPVKAELDFVELGSGDQDFRILQEGLKAVGVLPLPDPGESKYKVPVLILNCARNAVEKQSTKEIDEGDASAFG